VAEPIDLLAGDAEGPIWGTATEDLNATLLVWPPGHEVAEHVNDERDVLLVVVAGAALVTVDGGDVAVGAGHALLVEKGRSRAIRAGAEGVRYLSVHRRRGPLQVEGA
jgi:mannose-6-phosphate isomerase-like protein (cupin superfamily)